MGQITEELIARNSLSTALFRMYLSKVINSDTTAMGKLAAKLALHQIEEIEDLIDEGILTPQDFDEMVLDHTKTEEIQDG